MMKAPLFFLLQASCVVVVPVFSSSTTTTTSTTGKELTSTKPPRGWNSYDSYTWFVNETQFLDNCQYMADNLLEFGYEYCVIDYLWYKDNDGDGEGKGGTWNLDDDCFPTPSLERWPSASKKDGFKVIAEKVHSMGLKFGIHIMRGTSKTAIEKNCPIRNSKNNATIASVAKADGACPWGDGQSTSIDVSTDDGKLYYDNLYKLYAGWGVDFIKNDCMFGSEYVGDEILASANSILKTGRAITYSLSAGAGDLTDNLVEADEVSVVDWSRRPEPGRRGLVRISIGLISDNWVAHASHVAPHPPPPPPPASVQQNTCSPPLYYLYIISSPDIVRCEHVPYNRR